MDFDLTLAKDVLTAAGVLTGIGLGIWNRLDFIRAEKRRKEKEEPRVIARLGEELNGWWKLSLTVTPKDNEPFEVLEASINRGLYIARSAYRSEQRSRVVRGSSFWETEGFVDVRNVAVPIPDVESKGKSVAIGAPVNGSSKRAIVWVSGDARTMSSSMEPQITLKCRSTSNNRRYFLIKATASKASVAS